QAHHIIDAEGLSESLLAKRKDKLSLHLRSLAKSQRLFHSERHPASQLDRKETERLPLNIFTPDTLHIDLTDVAYSGVSLVEYLPYDVRQSMRGELKRLANQAALSRAGQVRLNFLILEAVYDKHIHLPLSEWLLTDYEQTTSLDAHGILGFYNPLAPDLQYGRQLPNVFTGIFKKRGDILHFDDTDIADQDIIEFCASYGLPHWPSRDELYYLEDKAAIFPDTGYDIKVLYPAAHIRHLAILFQTIRMAQEAVLARERTPEEISLAIHEASVNANITQTAGWIWGKVATERAIYAVMVFCIGDPFEDSETLRQDIKLLGGTMGIEWDDLSLKRLHRRCNDHASVPFPMVLKVAVDHCVEVILNPKSSTSPIDHIPISMVFRPGTDSLCDIMGIMLYLEIIDANAHARICQECGKPFIGGRSNGKFCPSGKKDKESKCALKNRAKRHYHKHKAD
ncbi:MAG TPA: hypothetical protein VGL77_20205, partial [Armatimonadota bacterium]